MKAITSSPDHENPLELWYNMPPELRGREFSDSKQLAYKFGVTEAHIRNMADQGKFDPAAIKPLGRWLFHNRTLFRCMTQK